MFPEELAEKRVGNYPKICQTKKYKTRPKSALQNPGANLLPNASHQPPFRAAPPDGKRGEARARLDAAAAAPRGEGFVLVRVSIRALLI